MKRFMVHGKLTASRAELADDKAVRNRGGAGGAAPNTPPKKVGLESQGFWGGWRGERLPKSTMAPWGIWYTAIGRGVPPRRGRGSPLYEGTKPKLYILVNF